MISLYNSNLTISTFAPEIQTFCQPSARIWKSLQIHASYPNLGIFTVDSYT